MKKVLLLFLTALLLLLPSCDRVAEWLWEENYEKEEVKLIHGGDSAIASELCAFLEPLFTTSLDPIFFDRFSEQKTELVDRLLASMLAQNFALYTGESELYTAAKALYPDRLLPFLIPREEVDYFLHHTYDEVNVRPANTSHFTYLEPIDAYTAERQPLREERAYTIYECVETEKTYRLLLRAYADTEEGGESAYGEKFEVLFIKYEEGYTIRSVTKR